MRKLLAPIITLMILGSILPAMAQDEPFRIVATTTQASDIARILTEGVAEEDVSIVALMGAGVDPHLYQPSEADIAAMSEADMIIYSGLNLEGRFDAVFAALGERGVLIYSMAQPVVDAGFALASLDQEAAEEYAEDPHFWFDPRNWQLTTEDLAMTLSSMDPENEAIYMSNAEAYIAQLDLLYQWALEGMQQVAEEQRYLVTSHDAFQYFGDAFGWQMQAIQGISTESEAGVGDIQDIVDFVVDNQIPVVFVESSVPANTINAVQEAAEARGADVTRGLRELFSDAMGEPGEFGGTYIGMIAHNVYTILQSYEATGVELSIPEWPADLLPAPPEELLEAQAEAGA